MFAVKLLREKNMNESKTKKKLWNFVYLINHIQINMIVAYCHTNCFDFSEIFQITRRKK